MSTKLRNNRTAVVAFCLGLGAASLSNPGFAISVDNYRTKGEAADAHWYSSDSCSDTYTDVYASETLTPGASASNQANFYNSYSDYCTGRYIYLSSYASPVQFSGTRTSSAQLQTTMQVSGWEYGDPSVTSCGDFYCSINRTVTINLSWKGNNDAIRTTYTSRSQYPNAMYMSRQTGSQATATASGSITFEDGTSLITGNSAWGSITDSSGGTIQIVHY